MEIFLFFFKFLKKVVWFQNELDWALLDLQYGPEDPTHLQSFQKRASEMRPILIFN